MRRFGIALGLLCVLCGCEDDLPKVTLIQHMRVLGARTSVKGDETRTTPRPGETAHMAWTVAFTDVASSDAELSSLFLSCTAPTRYTGNPVCQELVDLATGKRPTGFGFGAPAGCDAKPDSVQNVAGIQLVCVTGTPQLDVYVPASGKQSRLVQGIICRNGVPQFDLESPTGASCLKKDGVKDEDFESISVTGQVPLELEDEQQNRNPDISKIELIVVPEKGSSENVEPWEPVPADQLPSLAEDCLAGDVVKRSNGYPMVIEIHPPEDSWEGGEDLVFSTYATLGEVSRRFTVFEADPDEQVESSDLTWELSDEQRDELLDKPTLVRFFFTVSDERGGFDVTTRELCVDRS